MATSTTTQYDKIMAPMDELKTFSIAASATTVGGNRYIATGRLNPDKRTKYNLRINQLMSKIKGKWVPGGFYSTHGHGVGAGHSIKNCNNKTKNGETGGHNNNATCANPSGPDQNMNKYWDKMLLWKGRGANDGLNLDFAVAANPFFYLVLAVDPPFLPISHPPTPQLPTPVPAGYISLQRHHVPTSIQPR